MADTHESVTAGKLWPSAKNLKEHWDIKDGGYFPDLKKHKMNWNNDDGSYYDDFSIIQIKEKFNEIGLEDSEFSIRSLKVDDQNDALDYQTIIEIHKT